jgi:DNA-binding transcriptional ArsR family regulator
MDLYHAVADPSRRQIIELLLRRPLPAGQVADAFAHISRPAVSRHLRVLREAGLVHDQLDGRQRIYRADTGPLGAIETWIAGLRPQWDQHLDALDTEVHRTRRERERQQQGAPSPDEATTEEQSA